MCRASLSGLLCVDAPCYTGYPLSTAVRRSRAFVTPAPKQAEILRKKSEHPHMNCGVIVAQPTARRLVASPHSREIQPDSRVTRHRQQRHVRTLRVLESYRAEASQREIATRFFDLSVTRDEWQVSSERHFIRDMLRDGRSMSLLAHRPAARTRHRLLASAFEFYSLKDAEAEA